MSITIDQLNQKLGATDHVYVEPGTGGLARVHMQSPGAAVKVYLHGAHVAHFQPTGQEPVLWSSGLSRFEDGHAIRGGVPICFPWFAQKSDDPAAPVHGSVRTRAWQINSLASLVDGSCQLAFSTHTPVTSLANGSGNSAESADQFHLTYTITLDADTDGPLTMELKVRNIGDAASFEAALHSYFSVADIRQVQLTGLEGTSYIDKTDGGARKLQEESAVIFTGETDRVYLDTSADCQIMDPLMQRAIRIHKSGSQSTVVWNPWINKAARMVGFPNDQWPNMLCVETANVADNRILLQPGASHVMSASISLSPVVS
jgi:glucose-6-phosphate 1-epimerase